MFIRIWHKPDNVGSNDPTIEEYVAISTIRRFYSRRYEDDATNRYIVSTGTDNPYITKDTFEYLKSLGLDGQTCAVKKKASARPGVRVEDLER